MLIIRGNTGITIKRRIQDENHVRIGVFQTALWVHGGRRAVRVNTKPSGEYSINDCSDLLEELEYLKRMT